MKIKNLLIIGLAVCALAGVSANAQTSTNSSGGTGSVQNLIPPGTIPSGATLPAFNTNGLSFTNANYKIATGSEFASGGGVLNYIQGDADLVHLSSIDLGLGANGTLSATGTGLHTAAGFGELIKNFNNFQLALKGGAGCNFDPTPQFYGAEVAEIDYNLTSLTSGFLAGNNLFTFVGANVELDEGNFQTGGKYQKQFCVFAGVAF